MARVNQAELNPVTYFLRGIDTLAEGKEGNLVKIVFCLPSEKGPKRVEPFSKRDWCIGKQKGIHRSYVPCINWEKFHQVYTFPLTLVLLNSDRHCLCKLRRSRSVGFFTDLYLHSLPLSV